MSTPQEVGDLRKTLNTEVEGLRSEFMELKTALKQQLELTAGLAAQVGVFRKPMRLPRKPCRSSV